MATISAAKILLFIDICKFLGKKRVCKLVFFEILEFLYSIYGNPIFQRSYFISKQHTKKILLMLYKRMGVWHNPGIIKQKQYIPKYALTLANLIP